MHYGSRFPNHSVSNRRGTRGKYCRRRGLSRRRFMAGLLGTVVLAPAGAATTYRANEKLNVALVGVGGRGRWFVDCIPRIGENVVAMCDVNAKRAAESFAKMPNVPKFDDWRNMLDKMDSQIEAVIVAVPDHNHAPITMAAIKRGKHVYCEKPLTHDVGEARLIRQAAAQSGVATQMGNQGTATDAFRRGVELIQSGFLGTVEQVFVWKDSGGTGPQPLPEDTQPVPDWLNWDVWLGPAPYRPFNTRWLSWHRWRDFGTGNLGNWATHSANMAFMGLKIDTLWYATDKPQEARSISLVAQVESPTTHCFPRWEIIDYEIPARDQMPAVKLTWFNGSRAPDMRNKVERLMGKRLDWGDAGERKWADHAGALIVGSEGMIHTTSHNSSFSLLPEEKFRDVKDPKPFLPRSGSHEREWIKACKGGPKPMSNFGYSGPLTELLMLGNIATLFPGTRLIYDPVEGRITNHDEANRYILRRYREGWTL